MEQFLGRIGTKLKLRSFPAHAEVRIDENGKILPVEINPLRFGGWCTTADLSGIALGFNPYSCYFDNACPDWDRIYQGKENKIFSLVVLDNNSGIHPADIRGFDYEALANDFEKPLSVRQLDIHDFPLFGFVFAETDPSHMEELYHILGSDLRKYILKRP